MQFTDAMVLLVVLIAGFMRGLTGFGGAMVMAVPLSLMLGPVPAVIIALTLETAAALVMFSNALPLLNMRTLAFLTLPACLSVPFGGYLLLTIDPETARRLISLVVVVFSALLVSGYRYTGTPRRVTMIGLGSIVGVLLGATSVGAPPVILYLLSSSDPQRVIRANLTAFVTAISIVGLLMLTAAGQITLERLAYAAFLAVPFILATWGGGLLFERVQETNVRRCALATMLAIGLIGLLI